MLVSAIIISILALLFLRVPVFASLILGTLIPFSIVEGNHAVNLLADVFYTRLANYLFVAIPAFALMAQILVRTDAITDLYNSLYTITKRLPGSLGVATIALSTTFSAISGSSVATTLTVGGVAIPQMRRFGYPRRFIFGLVAAGGTLGILIPPSIGLIVYGVIADVSIGALFLAAMVPALLLVSLFSVFTLIMGFRMPQVTPPKSIADSGGKKYWRSIPTLTLPLIIIGGIYGGAFTATEAAVVAAVWAALIAAILYRKFSFAFLMDSARASARTTVMLFFIVGGAAYFSHVLVYLNLPDLLLDFMLTLELSRTFLFASLLFGILLLGMFMDGMSVTLITTPIIVPVLNAFGFDLLWYGVVLIITLEASLLTPPVGLNLYVIKSISDAKFNEVLLGVLPFLALMVCTLILIIVFPQLVLWFPSKVFQ
ncbi:MAG: TRAP transporter large permease [Gammaproteobacteria bacterium]|nr:TRAP transporter large permease [Gammaproteobacteria bacterium]